ncbi:MAG: hypothetical protein HQK56_17625 [Deltaproteobacteria bacterium]|nr:hypothetical protein [Deltaproteobacteria bacterium]
MALFSQRKGIRPLHKAIQREAIDDELRNRLWNELTIFIWNRWAPMDKILLHQPEGGGVSNILFNEFGLITSRNPSTHALISNRGIRSRPTKYFASTSWRSNGGRFMTLSSSY